MVAIILGMSTGTLTLRVSKAVRMKDQMEHIRLRSG